MTEVGKRYLVHAMAHNLGVILRKLIGVGKPREWAALRACFAARKALLAAILGVAGAAGRRIRELVRDAFSPNFDPRLARWELRITPSSTACQLAACATVGEMRADSSPRVACGYPASG